MTITIVDYGVGNLGSIPNMLARIGATSVITSDPSEILAADRLILPGVGAFDAGMRSLVEHGLVDVLRRRVIDDGVIALGLCLGMQLMFESSEEGGLAGLGWIPGRVTRFRFGSDDGHLRVPHMGWNTVEPQRASPLLLGLETEPRFYFAHSYYAACRDESDIVGTTEYGHPFVSVVQRNNTFGAQFHPEKSHRFGLQFLRNFVAL